MSEDEKWKNKQNEFSAKDLSEDEIRESVLAETDSEEITGDPYLKSAEHIKELTGQEGLGNVKNIRGETSQNIDMSLGWVPLDVENFPSFGKYYEEDFKVSIRAAKAAEIRQWSTLNERDLYDIESKLNYIVQECTRIFAGKRRLSWKDLLEEDRIYLILSIRELTFKDGENSLSVSRNCNHCGVENTFDIITPNLQRTEIIEDIEKYYDPVERLYNIRTKNYGLIKMKPPTIGIMGIVNNYIREKHHKDAYYDESFMQLFPYLYHDWKIFSSKDEKKVNKIIFDAEVEFNGWSREKYMLIYRIAEKMKVSIKPEIIKPCDNCDEEIAAQIDFRNGIKAIFIPVISDITDELL